MRLGDPNQEGIREQSRIETFLCQSEELPCPVHGATRGAWEQVSPSTSRRKNWLLPKVNSKREWSTCLSDFVAGTKWKGRKIFCTKQAQWEAEPSWWIEGYTWSAGAQGVKHVNVERKLGLAVHFLHGRKGSSRRTSRPTRAVTGHSSNWRAPSHRSQGGKYACPFALGEAWPLASEASHHIDILDKMVWLKVRDAETWQTHGQWSPTIVGNQPLSVLFSLQLNSIQGTSLYSSIRWN